MKETSLLGCCYWETYIHTVDGQNPAPPRMMNIPLFIGFYTSQVVQDFFHQQYPLIRWRNRGPCLHQKFFSQDVGGTQSCGLCHSADLARKGS